MTRAPRPEVTADGVGIVSHAGSVLLRELADDSGLTAGWTDAVIGTYRGTPTHQPGRVLVDLAVTLADGGDCLADLAALRDQEALFGPVASHPTSYRVLDRVGAVQLDALRTARADARARAWAAGAGPDLTVDGNGDVLILDVDASLLTAHSEKEDAAPTYKRTFGVHPLLVFLDRPDVSSGEALAWLGSCAQATPGPTPPPTTSPCRTWPSRSSPNTPGRSRKTPRWRWPRKVRGS
jgi:hypothetical protein